jgi:hypothetical protein
MSKEKTILERIMPPVVFQLPGLDSVRVQANLKYTGVDNPNLLMDVYAPANLAPADHRPVVICIHGAGSAEYRAKDWGIFQSWGRLIAAAGMIGVTFTHRMGWPDPHLDEAHDDLTNALRYIRANADALNADPDAICLMAWSGSGPLLTAAMRETPAFVRCLIAFYAFLDCEHASSTIPMFVARAGQDQIPGVNDSIDRFVAAAIASNAPITLMNHPTGEHGFDNQNDDNRSHEIIQSALAFMHNHLR